MLSSSATRIKISGIFSNFEYLSSTIWEQHLEPTPLISNSNSSTYSKLVEKVIQSLWASVFRIDGMIIIFSIYFRMSVKVKWDNIGENVS